MKRIDRSEKVRVGFHQAKWDEPIIYELSTPGERGILVPKASAQVAQEVGDGFSSIPAGMARNTPVNLPEMAQNRVLRPSGPADSGCRCEHRDRPGHLHREIQPQGQRPAGPPH